MKLFLYMRFTFLLLLFPISLFGQNHCYVGFPLVLNDSICEIKCRTNFEKVSRLNGEITIDSDSLDKLFTIWIKESSLRLDVDELMTNGQELDPINFNGENFADSAMKLRAMWSLSRIPFFPLIKDEKFSFELIEMTTGGPIGEWGEVGRDTIAFSSSLIYSAEEWELDKGMFRKSLIGLGLLTNDNYSPPFDVKHRNVNKEYALVAKNVSYNWLLDEGLNDKEWENGSRIKDSYSPFVSSLFINFRRDAYDFFQIPLSSVKRKNQTVLELYNTIDVAEAHQLSLSKSPEKWCDIQRISDNDKNCFLVDSVYIGAIRSLKMDSIFIGFDRLAGFRFLEDWYIHPETGALYKDVKGMMLLFYWYDENGEPIVYPWAGKTVYIRFHE